MSENFAELLAEEEDPARYLEAWLYANGRWEKALCYLAQKQPGQAIPGRWYDSEQVGTLCEYTCRICGVQLGLQDVADGTVTMSISRQISDHGYKHLEKLRKALKLKLSVGEW